jgi:hypothetical protein
MREEVSQCLSWSYGACNKHQQARGGTENYLCFSGSARARPARQAWHALRRGHWDGGAASLSPHGVRGAAPLRAGGDLRGLNDGVSTLFIY